MAAVALINSTHKMNGQTRPLREQNAPPSATQGKSFQKIRNLQETLRAGLTKRSSTDLTAEGDQTLKATKSRQRRESNNGDGARRLLGLGLRRTESKAALAQNGGSPPKEERRGWTPFRAPTLRIATLSSPDLNKLADDADVTPSIHALISAPKTRRPTVQNMHNPPPPSTPTRAHRPPSPVSPSPTPRRRPTGPSSPGQSAASPVQSGASPESRSRSPAASTQPAMYGVDPDEMFEDEDLLDNTPEGLGNVARTLLHLASLIENERQSFVVVHDHGKAKSTVFVSASRIVSKTEPVQFDGKAEGFGMTQSGNANGGRSPYGTLSRQLGVMSNPELASAARPTSPARERDRSPPVAIGHRPSQRTSSVSPAPSAPSSPKPFASPRLPNYSPKAKVTRVVTPESKGARTPSPLLERPRLGTRRPSVDSRPSFAEPSAPSPISPPPLSPLRRNPTCASNQRQSTTSMVTNSSQMTDSTAAFSSLLDSRYSNGFGTMRTNTTEATSPSSGIPSFSRSEANEAAKAVLLTESPKATRARLSENGNSPADRPHSPDEAQAPAVSGPVGARASAHRRDRRSSEAAADLTRVNEEPDESSTTTSAVAPSKLLARRRSRILEANDPGGKRVARKWPDDFDSALDAETNPIDELEKELMGGDITNANVMDTEIKPPLALRPIVIPSRADMQPPPLLSSEELQQTRSRPILVPRRSKRYSGESGILPSPREGIVLGAGGRDGSPSSGAESSGMGGPPPLLRGPSRRYVPKGSTPPGSEIMDRRSPPAVGPSPLSAGLPNGTPRVPFPRAVSIEFAPSSRLPTLPSSSETLREDAVGKEEKGKEGQKALEREKTREKEKKRASEPRPQPPVQSQSQPQPQRPTGSRGRHQSEYDSQRRAKPRPGSMDE
ncbi:hypothetical protein FRC12_011090, partial [Ceratobasidium sp. 428]